MNELLAMMAASVLLVATILPALAHPRPNSQAFQCMNNVKQLMMGWSMYAPDFNERLVPTAGLGALQTVVTPTHVYPVNVQQWCMGSMNTADSPTTPTNYVLIQDSLLFPYVKSLSAYKCPADKKTTNDPLGLRAGGKPTVRSMSMNAWMNPLANQMWAPDDPNGNPPRRNFRKITDIFKAASTWVIQDENPLALDDSWFVVDPASANWVDIPGTYHEDANSIGFADGHMEMKKWGDPAILGLKGNIGTKPRDGGKDLQWLKDRTTY
ncbi:MAG TPA: hypothetical protein VLU94_00155 [Candidatus Nitrosotalea sp.]|nr:hypothetical protein [Candidatus Nitrosotalea sp.]